MVLCNYDTIDLLNMLFIQHLPQLEDYQPILSEILKTVVLDEVQRFSNMTSTPVQVLEPLPINK